MARQLRIEYKGAFYHITSRGNQREKIYWDDKDREEFKKILKRTKEIYSYFLHAYVLIDNHYHLLIETPHANIKQIMHNINTSYTVYVNRRHKRFGHLFQGRYQAFIVDKESYLLELGRYIHLNPVRAGVVSMPEDYRWSSYREYLQIDRQQVITNTDDTLYSFSRKRAVAVKKYQEFMNARISGESPLKDAVGSILGDETFRNRVIWYLKGIPDKTEIPELKKIETKHNIEDIVKEIAKYYRVEEDDLLKRRKATERQRKIAMYLCKRLSGKRNIEVGGKFGVTLQAISNAIRDIERKSDRDRKLNNEINLIKRSIE